MGGARQAATNDWRHSREVRVFRHPRSFIPGRPRAEERGMARHDARELPLDALATAVLWITPELAFRTANARGVKLLRDLDVSRPKNAKRLERAVGAHACPLQANEARWLRRLLGAPSHGARRRRVRLGALWLDVGIAPLRGACGEWLGWAVDAAPPSEAHASTHDHDALLGAGFLSRARATREPDAALPSPATAPARIRC